MKMVKFPDIEQFRNVVQSLRLRARFISKNEDGTSNYDESKKADPVSFLGTVKLDGTNAAICYDGNDVWFQSRERILTLEEDNYGFCRTMSADHRVSVLLKTLSEKLNFVGETKTLCVFGEYLGKGIAKGMAINQIEKKEFVIFGVAICSFFESADDANDNLKREWQDLALLKEVIETAGFDTVLSSPTYNLVLDPESAETAWNEAKLLTDAVVEECPFGKVRGKTGPGEGIVWVGTDKSGKTFLFKTKGEKQSVVSSPKELPSFEQTTALETFIGDVLTEARLNQGIERVFTSAGLIPSVEKTGAFLQWVGKDVDKEEGYSIEALEAVNIDRKKAMGEVNRKARAWFITYLDKQVMM